MILLLVTSLSAVPASPLSLVPLRSTQVLVAMHPCPLAAASAPPTPASEERNAASTSFCVGRLRAVVTNWRNSLVSRLEVYDQVTAAKGLEARVEGLGLFALLGDRLYYWVRRELWSLAPSSPSTRPRKLAPCDCGTEASPFLPAVLGGAAICYATDEGLEPTSLPGALRLSTSAVGDADPIVCTISREAWTDEPFRITIRLSEPTAACRQVLRHRSSQPRRGSSSSPRAFGASRQGLPLRSSPTSRPWAR